MSAASLTTIAPEWAEEWAMPLSKDPEARARQLANLRRAPAAPEGNARATTHGAYSDVEPGRLEARVVEVFDALSVAAPVREEGELPAADVAMVRLAAEALEKVDQLERYVALHGLLDRKGKVQPAAVLLERWSARAERLLERLGMSPTARAALGVNVAAAAALLDPDRFESFAPPSDDHRAEVLDRLRRAGAFDGLEGDVVDGTADDVDPAPAAELVTLEALPDRPPPSSRSASAAGPSAGRDDALEAARAAARAALSPSRHRPTTGGPDAA